MEHLITEKDGLSLLETPNKHGLTPLLSASIWANAVNYLLDQVKQAFLIVLMH